MLAMFNLPLSFTCFSVRRDGQSKAFAKCIQRFHRQPTMPVVKLRQGRFIDPCFLGNLVTRQARIVDGHSQLIS